MDSDYNTIVYLYLNEDQSENNGTYVGYDGQDTGVWNFNEATSYDGTWKSDITSEEGTWWAEESDPYTFVIYITGEVYVATTEGEDCGWSDNLGYWVDCADGLSCEQ